MPPADVDSLDGRQDDADGPRCKGVRESDGKPCQAPSKLVDPETGYCPSHGPDAAERLSEYGRKGGETTARRHHGRGGLTTDDLPPLVDHEAAEIWTDLIGRAAATNRLSAAAANAALRAVKEWREAHDAGQLSDRVERIEAAVSASRKAGSLDPLLEVMDGGKA